LCGQNIHLYHFDDGAKIIAFHRWDKQDPTDSVVVGVNMMNENRDDYVIGFPWAGLWKTRFNSDSYIYGPHFANHPAPDVEAHEKKSMGCPAPAKSGSGHTRWQFSRRRDKNPFMEISKKTLNTSQHSGNLPGGKGAHDSVQLLEKARADTDLNELGSQLSGTGEADGTVYNAAGAAARPSVDYTVRAPITTLFLDIGKCPAAE